MNSAAVPKLIKQYSARKLKGEVFRGDALKFLHLLPENSADIVFLDPPFNLGKLYSTVDKKIDRRSEEDYWSWLLQVLLQAARVTKPGGVLFLYHLPIWAMRLAARAEQDTELQFFHWIAVSMKNGFVRGNRLYPAHYALLMLSKGVPEHFNRPKLPPTKCRHCKKLVKDYGGYRKIIESKGINLSDFWEDLSPVRHSNRKNRSANELPEALFDRVMKMSAVKNGLYVDPFSGSGTGVLAAAKCSMRFSACDLMRENCVLLCDRLDKE